MLFLLEYLALFAGIIGTAAMLAFAPSILILIPNFVLIFVCAFGIYLTHNKKKYELAAMIIVGGCAYIALPVMFFTSGGNKSGMPIWFLFGIIFICMMLKGKLRIIMSGIGILIPIACMLLGFYRPDLVLPLKNSESEFLDMLQSFSIVSIIVCICLYIYISSYDRQRVILLKQSQELKEAMYTDALTGIANRRAYYDDTKKYSEGEYDEKLVIVALDVNGLKMINDSKGHAAGDELIKNATAIMLDAYSKYGKIYRTGGDEFIAILSCNNEEAEKLVDIITSSAQNANAKNNTDISIASGVAAWSQNSDKNFFELEKLADYIMYQNKSKYYRESGIDRRKR